MEKYPLRQLAGGLPYGKHGFGAERRGRRRRLGSLNWTRLSCHKFVANQVRLWLFILAYNLGNFLRRLVLPEEMRHWTLTRSTALQYAQWPHSHGVTAPLLSLKAQNHLSLLKSILWGSPFALDVPITVTNPDTQKQASQVPGEAG